MELGLASVVNPKYPCYIGWFADTSCVADLEKVSNAWERVDLGLSHLTIDEFKWYAISILFKVDELKDK